MYNIGNNSPFCLNDLAAGIVHSYAISTNNTVTIESGYSRVGKCNVSL